MKLQELIKECCQQKLAAQSEVYQLYANKLFPICLKYSKNYQDAEDTLQDSFLIIFEKIKQYQNKGSFEGWLKRITINTALQKYREKQPLQIVKEVSENEEIEEIELESTSFNVDVLLSFIQKLPDRYRLVFNLYVLDNYAHKEIANLLNITESTSKSNLSRARKILKKQLEIHQQKEQKA
ncbi:RNA polymerase sigma factor [Polaribacter aestuariivivens]|uniref:RNA polymerase sigma factor n=1 Tax=Polaribacter aestuariivivens TaxID=2304626 RepID=A0A5S3N5C5_9FLAO|nr:RNA polymerase sigma factor [Polaribacter aestuariivivens]TMM30460.1 RNA polymerase sigma factor [Polaribacter aestuariivivens]